MSAPGAGHGGQAVFALVAAVVLAADRVSKGLVTASIPFGEERRVLPFLWFTNTTNSGMAFGLARWSTGLLLLASIAVAVLLVWYAARNRLGAGSGGVLGLILGGTLGNGYDRLVHGAATDWVALHWFYIFNIADAAISVGVVLLLLGYLLRPKPIAGG